MELKYRVTEVTKYKSDKGPMTAVDFEPVEEDKLPKFGRKKEYYPPNTVINVPYKLYYEGYTSHNPGEIFTITISYD